jgi:hypothetical protein
MEKDKVADRRKREKQIERIWSRKYRARKKREI